MEYESEIHKLLKIGAPAEEVHHLGSGQEHMTPHEAVEELSIASDSTAAIEEVSVQVGSKLGKALKMLVGYVMLFLAAFVFFYSVINFGAFWSQIQGWFSKPQDEQILGEDLQEYYKWIGNYFYAVGDDKFLEPTNDIDKDGLSNHDEFVMRTNPIIADSDSANFTDGVELLNGYNPWGRGQMTANQKKLSESIDLNLINNRISFSTSQIPEGVVSGGSMIAYNLDLPGRISIPKLNLQVPLIWSKDVSQFDADLTKGIIHYPGTALPGENGIIYVSGHSSDYLWKRNPMQNVFSRLNNLAPGDDIFVEVYGNDGKTYNFRYQVTGSKTYRPDDQSKFTDGSGSKLNLSTCWPIGTTKDRLVVSAVPVAL